MLTSSDGASSLDSGSDGYGAYMELSILPNFECNSRSLSKASSYLDMDGLLEGSRQQHFLVVDDGLHDPCSPSDMHHFGHFTLGHSSSPSSRDKELYCLVVVDNETGIPVRAATDSETEEVARLLADYEPYGLTACHPFHTHPSSQSHSQQHIQQEESPQQHLEHTHHHQHGDKQHQHQHLIQQAMQQAMQHQVQQTAEQACAVQPSASTCDSTEIEQHSSDESIVCPKPAPRPFNHKSGGPCDHCGAKESPQWRRGPPAKPVLCNACGTRYRRTNQLGTPQNGGSRGGSTAKRRSPPVDVQSHSSSEDLRTRCLKQQRIASLVSCEA